MMKMVDENDVDVEINLILKKEFQEKHQFTEEEIQECIESIRTFVFEFIEQYIDQIKSNKKIDKKYEKNGMFI